MQIQNLRLGFATNSSSSHSIVIVPPRKKLRDDLGCVDDHGGYGWEHFVLASKEAKRNYFSTQLFLALRHEVGDEIAAAAVFSLFHSPRFDHNIATNTWGDDAPYVDHQSCWGVPLRWNAGTGRYWRENGPNMQFVQELYDFVVNRDDVAIVGGNDNEPRDVAKEFGVERVPNPLFNWDRYPSTLVARKDGEWWTVFNRANGTKIRFSFNEHAKPLKYAAAPELVDMKITNYCPEGCSHCYQSSTSQGLHADVQTVDALIHSLAEMKVFEVAIGGGEPTDHPEFAHILKECWEWGVVPNFSTRSLRWLNNTEIVDVVREHVGSFAYTIHNRNDVEKFHKLCEKVGLLAFDRDRERRPVLQLVMGTEGPGSTEWEFDCILRQAAEHNLRTTLLGFKRQGRAKNIKPKDYSWWPKVIAKLQKDDVYPCVAIDTSLAAESKKGLKSLAIAEALYETSDGTFSAYIDAVTGKMGPSSYVSASAMRPYGELRWKDDKPLRAVWERIRKPLPKRSAPIDRDDYLHTY